MMSTTCGMDMDNYPSKFCNDYYCIYCEKTLSRNVKHIDDQNNSKSHIRFIKLQENTQALKRIEQGREREREREKNESGLKISNWQELGGYTNVQNFLQAP